MFQPITTNAPFDILIESLDQLFFIQFAGSAGASS